MDERRAPVPDPQQLRYRVVIEGQLDGSWASWFGCEHFESEGGQTLLEVEVVDQAQLHAVLRRVHDLHLRLVSVSRVGSGTFQLEGGFP